MIEIVFVIFVAIIIGSIIISGSPNAARFFQPAVEPAPTPIQSGTCSGTPNPCSSYTDLDSCVTFAGCSYVENKISAYCTQLTGPKACNSYANQADCQQASCTWQGFIPEPQPQPAPEPAPSLAIT